MNHLHDIEGRCTCAARLLASSIMMIALALPCGATNQSNRNRPSSGRYTLSSGKSNGIHVRGTSTIYTGQWSLPKLKDNSQTSGQMSRRAALRKAQQQASGEPDYVKDMERLMKKKNGTTGGASGKGSSVKGTNKITVNPKYQKSKDQY